MKAITSKTRHTVVKVSGVSRKRERNMVWAREARRYFGDTPFYAHKTAFSLITGVVKIISSL